MDSMFDALIAKSLAGSGGGGGGGTTNYNALDNRPAINGITLEGDLSTTDLQITAASVGALPDTTKYAASSTAGGSASSAVKLDNAADAGATNKPVYFNNGKPAAIAYEVNASVPADAVFTDTTYESKSAASGGTAVSLVTTGEKYIWNNKSDLELGNTATTAAAGNHTHTLNIATDAGTSQISLAPNTKYKLTGGGETYVFTTPADTTYTFDGTYSASTNKAATVSTVTNAINALDVTGASNISAAKTISAWSETDGKVSVSTQDIAIAGTQAVLTGYQKSTTAGQAVAATDNVNQAIGKVEKRVEDNENNISSIANVGVKNLCKPNVSADSEVTVVVNADLSITVTCNTTALREVHIFTDLSGLTDGKDYILSGCSGGNYSNTYGFAVRTSGGAGKAFESDGETTFTKTAEIVKMDLIIRSGQNWTKTFYPMIRPAYISDPTYQPYALSNTAITPALKECVDNGAKNLLDNKAVSSSIYTVNADKTVTANGTGNATITLATLTASEAYALNGMVLSGCPSGGSDSSYKLIIQRNSSPWNVYVRDLGNGAIISGIPEVACVVMIQVMTDTTVSNLVFKPMICTQADWNVSHTYFPYAMSNAELTNNISKYVYETVTVNLASQDISWTAYGSVYASSAIPLTQVGTVLSFVLIDWSGIRDTDLTLIPYQSSSAGNGFKMLSSTNTFLQSNSKVVYRVFGIKQST